MPWENDVWTAPAGRGGTAIDEPGYPTQEQYESYDAFLERELTKAKQQRARAMEYWYNPDSPKFRYLTPKDRKSLAHLGAEAAGGPVIPEKEPWPWPQWMRGYLPQIEQMYGQTPSLQAWRGAPWQVRAGMGVYTAEEGRTPWAETMGQMQAMLPKQPRGMGWGGTTWQPFRQR